MTSRVTRAKAAVAAGTATAEPTRLPVRRAALGDLSNVGKMTTTRALKPVTAASKPANTDSHASIKAHVQDSTRSFRRPLTSKSQESQSSTDVDSHHAPKPAHPSSRTSSNATLNSTRQSSTSESTDSSVNTLKRNAKAATSTAEAKLASKPSAVVDEDYFVEESAESRAAKRPRTQAWDDLDAEDYTDPLMVAEFTDEIFGYLHELEPKYMPNPDYIEDQKELEWSQRGLLMDWLVEIHSKLRLLPETLYLAGNIVDRFMTLRVVNLDKIQLVGVTALLLAAKYEEVFPPTITHFAYTTGGNFNEIDIRMAEKFVLQVLDFELSYPNPLNFLRRISKADDYDIQSRSFGKYFLEISVVDHNLISYPPSLHAAAAMYVARHILDRPGWDANLIHYSGDYEEDTIRPVAHKIVKYLASPVEHEALFKKYASKRFFKASLIACQWAKANPTCFAPKK